MPAQQGSKNLAGQCPIALWQGGREGVSIAVWICDFHRHVPIGIGLQINGLFYDLSFGNWIARFVDILAIRFLKRHNLWIHGRRERNILL